MAEWNPRANELFLKAVELPPADRAAYLARECGGDAALFRAVDALLAAHEKSAGFLAEPHPATNSTESHPDRAADDPAGTTNDIPGKDEHVGAVLAGKYRLIEAIGEGGMGSVFMARQTEPVKRLVAVKVIKAGMDSKTVLARFEAERQALALMDHPNIARVFDAGMTETGRPFFVMELVKGVPITQFCDNLKLTLRQRLELFAPVCHAIQHAHQKGVIHRDIKPRNVLVAMYDDRPVPKVIDFGVAKAAGPQLTEHTLVTGFGAVVGTPEYMSPEQASFNQMDVDTRSDVYSLGVLLYELLTGTTPIDRKSLGKAAIMEVLRIVREVEAPRPSNRLSTDAALPGIAANRGTEPSKLSKLLRGELDWVVMKALEKDRTRRYETANGLARDLQRYLADEVIEARPPSAVYRLRKFTRRHKGQVIAASLVLFALLAGLAGTSWGLLEARRQREIARGEATAKERARAAEAELRLLADEQQAKAWQSAAAEKAANEQARKRLTQIEKANDLLGSIFKSLDPEEIAKNERPLQAILVEQLDKAVTQLEDESIGDPLVVAAMQDKLGFSLLGLGEHGKATVLFEKAHATRQAKLGPDHPDTLTSMGNLSGGYYAVGKRDKALTLCEETLALMKTKLGPDHRETLTVMGNLAIGYKAVGKLDKALPLYEETLALRKAKFGPDHPDTLHSMHSLAVGYNAVGKIDKALPLFEETLALRKAKLGLDHPNTLASMCALAVGYHSAGKLDKALPLYEETLALRKAKLGRDHPRTLDSMNDLAWGYNAVGKPDKALPLFEETLALRKAKLGPDHPDTLTSMHGLATGYNSIGLLYKALPRYEETFALRKAKLGPDHPDTLSSMGDLAASYEADWRLDKALPLYEETFALRKAKLGPDHLDTLISMGKLAAGYQSAGKFDKALPLFEEMLALRKAKHGPRHAYTLASMSALAVGYHAAGKLDKALPLFEETLAVTKAKFGRDHANYLPSVINLSAGYRDARKFDKALPLYVETLALSKAKLGPDHSDTLHSMRNLAKTYQALGKLDKALPLYEETFARRSAMFGPDKPHTLTSMIDLAEGYRAVGRLDKALPIHDKAASAIEKREFRHPDSEHLILKTILAFEEAWQIDRANDWRRKWIAFMKRDGKGESTAFAGELAKWGSGFLREQNWSVAEELLRDCLAIREKNEPDDWRTFNTKSKLGHALLGQAQYAEAEPLLLAGYLGMKQREKSIHPQGIARIPEALDQLIELYTATNQPDEAVKWQAERAKYYELAPPPRVKK